MTITPRTAALLSTHTATIATQITKTRGDIANLEGQLTDRKALLAELEQHERELVWIRDLTEGRFAHPYPGDVTELPELGIAVGVFTWAPAPDAGPADLRLYAAFIRRLYEVAPTQALRAVDRAKEMEHREEQADVVTGRFEAVSPNGAAPEQEQVSAAHPIASHYGDHAAHEQDLSQVPHATPADLTEIVNRIGTLPPTSDHVPGAWPDPADEGAPLVDPEPEVPAEPRIPSVAEQEASDQ